MPLSVVLHGSLHWQEEGGSMGEYVGSKSCSHGGEEAELRNGLGLDNMMAYEARTRHP